ncbi:DUF2599 domain-containing protein [Xylanimonas oleitrophica]|uniref:DUF2599 domain-containing protein n=1 Tax=Xylanimonas oleitrophica TaxID=2607479 RepID=UPI001FE9FCDE|nr:DUF2599 domain-containing protein [Xylanimonas oleitrophica]
MPVAAGPVLLELAVPPSAVPGVTVSPEDDGVTTVTIDPSGIPPGQPVLMALGTPGSLAEQADGSVTVRDVDGTVVAGLTAPTGEASISVVDDVHAQLHLPAAAGPVETTLGTRALASTDWGQREGGRSVAVVPTDWARTAGAAGWELVWAQLVSAEPEVDSTTMHDQLVCHAVGAPDKAAWNLEPWRPAVGLLETMAARCNPT